ncbi:MAG: DUF4153 domain-containing protein [Sediminibacterium sp.]|nr:DUF4153 domain-containing protein [Chitinophagaceae bacterium]
MKLPSLQYLVFNAKKSFARFPLTIISALLSVTLGIFLVEQNQEERNLFPYFNGLLFGSLGIPLFFCVQIITEKFQLRNFKKWMLNLFALIILVILFFSFPWQISAESSAESYIRFILFNLTCHLLVSFIPFLDRKALNGFWQYNKQLFSRFIISNIYSSFIYLGLTFALLALNLLFDLKIHGNLYFDLFIVTAFFFNTWFFIADIPENFEALENKYEYPNGLKIFSQYVLIPLLTIYLLILYAYSAKIIITGIWPKGIVSYLIICVSVLGIFSLLLLYPYGELKENSWIRFAAKGFYWLLIPLLAIMFLAIFMRTSMYEITINRYFIIAIGIWLLIVCLFTIFQSQNIKFIPISLAILLVVISFGPWGVFSISEKSQVSRLKAILEKSNLLVNNKLVNENIWTTDKNNKVLIEKKFDNRKMMSDSLRNEVNSIIEYLEFFHGMKSINKWFGQNIDSILQVQYKTKKRNAFYSDDTFYLITMGLMEEYETASYEPEAQYSFSTNNRSIYETRGYDYMIEFEKYSYQDGLDIKTFSADKMEYTLRLSESGTESIVLLSKKDSIVFDYKKMINNLKLTYPNNEGDIKNADMTIFASSQALEAKIELQDLDFISKKEFIKLKDLKGVLFIRRKEN